VVSSLSTPIAFTWNSITFPYYCGSGPTKYTLSLKSGLNEIVKTELSSGTESISNIPVGTWTWGVRANNNNIFAPPNNLSSFSICQTLPSLSPLPSYPHLGS
jgi:hypothetical protein